MKEWYLKKIVALLVESAEIAQRIQKDVHYSLKSDRSVVTKADRRVECFLRRQLVNRNEDVYFIGEESAGRYTNKQLSEFLKKGVIWIVDPIDATANFAVGKSFWGISIAYAVDGVIREGGVFIPEMDSMLISDNGKTFYTNVKKKSVKAKLDSLVCLSKPAKRFSDASHVSFSQKVAKRMLFDGPNQFVSTGCCLGCGINLALGLDSVYTTMARLWDIAGFLPSLANLGFTSINRSGKKLISCRISDDLYCLDTKSDNAFMVREPNWIGISQDAVETVMRYCKEGDL